MTKFKKPQGITSFVTSRIPSNHFTPQKLWRTYDSRTVRKEYMRLRDINRKRLDRAFKEELITKRQYQRYSEKYVAQSQLDDKNIRALTIELYNALNRWETTIMGRRRALEMQAQSFEYRGITWANYGNALMIIQFLEIARDMALEKLTDGSPEYIKYLISLKEEPKSLDELVKGYVKHVRAQAEVDYKKW